MEHSELGSAEIDQMSKKVTSYREKVALPIGYEDPISNELFNEAEIRPVTGGDELYIGMSPEYNKNPNDLIYKTLLLARCVTKLGPRGLVTINDITRLHAQDVRALEYAIYRVTYGQDAIPEPDESDPSG
jgi:hypothetical protein